jgi:hypothetical protein
MNQRSLYAGQALATKAFACLKGGYSKSQPPAILKLLVRLEKRFAKATVEKQITLPGFKDATANFIFHR